MKKSIICIVAALAALAAVSCQKEDISVPSTSPRLCSFTFAPATKTVLDADGRTPRWAEGDVIRLMDDTEYQDITLTAADVAAMKGEIITVPTTLKGDPIYAVYPASATEQTSCYNTLNLKIPAFQEGTFASANICISLNDENGLFVFQNAASIVKVSQNSTEAGVLGVKIEADNKIAGGYNVFINDDFTFDATPQLVGESNQITVATKAGQKDYYIAVPGKVETGAIKLTYLKADTYATEAKASKTFALNTIYNLGNIEEKGLSFAPGRGVLNGHEFVQIAGLKWSTETMAISESGKQIWNNTGHMMGDYFRWGELDLIYDSILKLSYPQTDFTPGFVFKGAETFFSGWKNLRKLGKYDETTGVIKPEYDVARQLWGSTWRLPKGCNDDEFIKLYNATYWVKDNTDYGFYIFAADAAHPVSPLVDKVGHFQPYNGLDKKDALLFIPAVGYGKTNAVSNPGQLVLLMTDCADLEKGSVYRAYISPYAAPDEVRFKSGKNYESGGAQAMAADWFVGMHVLPVSD